MHLWNHAVFISLLGLLTGISCHALTQEDVAATWCLTEHVLIMIPWTVFFVCFLLLLMLYCSDERQFRVLLPFGSSFGDELLPASLFATSDQQSKLAISNITCPFFGTSESIIYVSVQYSYMQTNLKILVQQNMQFRQLRA